MGMQPIVTFQKHRYTAPPRRWLATHVLPTLLTLLLLALPVICIVHCRVAMQPAYHSTPSPQAPTSFFLCDLPLPTAATNLFTPAFLPGLLSQVEVFNSVLALILTLPALAPTSLRLLHDSPPTPPPRSNSIS